MSERVTQLLLPLAEGKRFEPVTARRVVVKGMTINGHRVVLQDGGKELERVCPKCHQRLPLSTFGLRVMSGRQQEIRLQAYCSPCRGEEE
jgi:hypothetical protein